MVSVVDYRAGKRNSDCIGENNAVAVHHIIALSHFAVVVGVVRIGV